MARGADDRKLGREKSQGGRRQKAVAGKVSGGRTTESWGGKSHRGADDRKLGREK